MFGANTYRIRFADGQDTDTLKHLAERNSDDPLAGRVLVGQVNGTLSGALSLTDGRVIVDPSPHTGRLAAALRMRAGAIQAFEETPSLPDRLRAAFATYRGAVVVPAPVSHEDYAEEIRQAA